MLNLQEGMDPSQECCSNVFFLSLWRVSKCQYVPTEMLIYMEMLFDTESLVTVTVRWSFQHAGYYCSRM